MKTRFLAVIHTLQAAVLGLAAVLFLGNFPTYAQSTYGTILGTVTDATGAVVPSLTFALPPVTWRISSGSGVQGLCPQRARVGKCL